MLLNKLPSERRNTTNVNPRVYTYYISSCWLRGGGIEPSHIYKYTEVFETIKKKLKTILLKKWDYEKTK